MVKIVPISVVIPVYNGEKTLFRLLNRLLYESTVIASQIIIVDGYSNDKTLDIANKFNNVEIYMNPKRHAASGRNIGIDYAKEEIIVFTDSDCLPDIKWLEIIYQTYTSYENIVGLGGKMLPLEPINEIEKFCGHVFLNEIMCFNPEKSLIYKRNFQSSFITANCSYKRQVLKELNSFDDFYSNHGEDIDLYWRAIDKFVGRLIYNPEIIVQHSFPTSLVELIKKFFQYGIASSKLSKHSLQLVTIDIYLYLRLVKHFSCFFKQIGSNKNFNNYYILQIVSHLLGKYYGSLISKKLNF